MAAALLLSGGVDSVALACWLRPALAITIDYGQRPAQGEIHAATMACRMLGLEHTFVRADCSQVGSGDLAGTEALGLAPVREWWPFRNQLLITLAAAVAVSRGMDEILIGTVASDAAHADGRVEFMSAMSRVLEVQEGGVRLVAPALHLTSDQLVRQPGVSVDALGWAHSCHVSEYACGSCRGCLKHRAVVHALIQDAP